MGFQEFLSKYIDMGYWHGGSTVVQNVLKLFSDSLGIYPSSPREIRLIMGPEKYFCERFELEKGNPFPELSGHKIIGIYEFSELVELIKKESEKPSFPEDIRLIRPSEKDAWAIFFKSHIE